MPGHRASAATNPQGRSAPPKAAPRFPIEVLRPACGGRAPRRGPRLSSGQRSRGEIGQYPRPFVSLPTTLGAGWFRPTGTRSNVRACGGIQDGPFPSRETGMATIDQITTEVIGHHFRSATDEMLAVLAHSEARTRAEIAKLKDGSYENEDFLDHDGIEERLVRIKVAVTVKGDELSFDFAGSDPQIAGARNCVMTVTLACVYHSVKPVIDPTLPPNAGYFRSIKVAATARSASTSWTPVRGASGASPRCSRSFRWALAPPSASRRSRAPATAIRSSAIPGWSRPTCARARSAPARQSATTASSSLPAAWRTRRPSCSAGRMRTEREPDAR